MTNSWRDRYLGLIDQIVQTTLKGQISSKEQVYQMLVQQVSPGTGEIFERCLEERQSEAQSQVDRPSDELKQAKATRSLRALKTIRGEWERALVQNQAANAIAAAVHHRGGNQQLRRLARPRHSRRPAPLRRPQRPSRPAAASRAGKRSMG